MVQIEGGQARGEEDRRELSSHIRCASLQVSHDHAGMLCLSAPDIGQIHIMVASFLQSGKAEAKALPHVLLGDHLSSWEEMFAHMHAAGGSKKISCDANADTCTLPACTMLPWLWLLCGAAAYGYAIVHCFEQNCQARGYAPQYCEYLQLLDILTCICELVGLLS